MDKLQHISHIATPRLPTQGKSGAVPKSERDEYVQKFTDRLNEIRQREGFKVLPTRFYAVKLSHLTIQDFHAFWRQCSEAESFSRCFFGKLKVR